MPEEQVRRRPEAVRTCRRNVQSMSRRHAVRIGLIMMWLMLTLTAASIPASAQISPGPTAPTSLCQSRTRPKGFVNPDREIGPIFAETVLAKWYVIALLVKQRMQFYP